MAAKKMVVMALMGWDHGEAKLTRLANNAYVGSSCVGVYRLPDPGVQEVKFSPLRQGTVQDQALQWLQKHGAECLDGPPLPGTPPVEPGETRELRVITVDPEAQESVRVHRIELGTYRHTYLGHHLLEQFNIEPGDTGVLSFQRDLRPEPVRRAVEIPERKSYWACGECGHRLDKEGKRRYPGDTCPTCRRTFNAEPKPLR